MQIGEGSLEELHEVFADVLLVRHGGVSNLGGVEQRSGDGTGVHQVAHLGQDLRLELEAWIEYDQHRIKAPSP